MHQPTTEPRPSIYYDYKVHGAWLPSQHGAQPRQQVVIAGSGPAGLVTALELARQGVPSVVVTPELQVSQVRVTAVGTARAVQGADLSLPDADGHFRQCYGIRVSGGAYLLRPDQHVCARWLTLDATRLQAAFDRALP